ncbi:MAG: gliding motility-associated C-terminal domain-containing protein, partial [Bacteroidia bacterium]
NQNICPEQTYTAQVEVHPLPKMAFLQSDTIGCAPLQVEFVNQTSIEKGSITSVLFNLGNGKITTVKDSGSVVKTEYGVIGTNDRYNGQLVATSDKGCKDSLAFSTLTLLRPKALFIPKPGRTTIITPSIIFENKSEYVIDENNYYWNFDDSLADNGGESFELNTRYTYQKVGEYQVLLKAYNRHINYGDTIDCVDSIINTIIIDPEVLVYIPNVFTPNNDGPNANNVFKPIVTDAQEYSVKVFNRWGELMWYSQNPEDSWNGEFQGEPCTEGVYLYVVNVKNHLSKDYEFTGTVTLLR